MTTPVNILGGENGNAAKVSQNGELIVAPISYSDVYQEESASITATNVVPGIPGKRFVITATIIAQDKTNTDVDVTMYESDDDITIPTKVLFTGGTTKSDRIIVPLLYVASGVTKWINFIHDSATATISVTITGYYIDA